MREIVNQIDPRERTRAGYDRHKHRKGSKVHAAVCSARTKGRIQEVLSFPKTGGGEARIHPLIFHDLLDLLPLGDSQIENSLRRALASRDAVAPRIDVQHVDAIPQTVTGKTPLVKSNLANARS